MWCQPWSRSVTAGADRAVSGGRAPKLARFPGFLHRSYMIPDHDRYTWKEVWGYPRRERGIREGVKR